MAINPFDIVLAQATEREAQKAAEREAAAKLRKEQARAAAEANRVKELSERRLKFGHRFLEVVATKVVRPEWGPNVILDIKQYTEAL
ncbi:MAG: hypothetical protein EOM14_16210, partial [Clostridia bacterium]|nr:hypothetical protein [Clostridia bacterium]